nr:hypothetical protein [Tanacetum cinerariifolium]
MWPSVVAMEDPKFENTSFPTEVGSPGATASDSSGVPPTIERSPLDFSLEVVASDQGAAASEVPPSGDVPAAAAPEPSRVGVAAADSPAATESRKRSTYGRHT